MEYHVGDLVQADAGVGRFVGTIVDITEHPRREPLYQVEYDGGLGHGSHTASELVHLASEDYPEMGDILYERPDPARHVAALGYPHDSDEGWQHMLFGCHHTSLGRVMPTPHEGYLRGTPEWEAAWHAKPDLSEHVHGAMEGADTYRTAMGLHVPKIDYSRVMADKNRHERIARAYLDLPDYDPRAEHSFQAMRDQVHDQFHHLTHNLGVHVQFTDHDPYTSHHDLARDLNQHGRLQVLRTATTGSHPLFSDNENDKFRAVHDFFGHAALRRGFDRHGEEAAWHHHATLFTPEARAALTTETRGQNAALIHTGQFQPQKIALLPSRFHDDDAVRNVKEGAIDKEAMPWHDSGGMSAEKAQARSVRDAGFRGYVGRSDWEDEIPADGFDEGLWEKHTPEPTHAEQVHYDHHGEYPDSFHERHENAFENALYAREREETPDYEDDHLHHWIAEHSDNPSSFTRHAKQPQKIDLRNGVWATQSHVGQFHVNRYRDNPVDESWHMHRFKHLMNETPDYLGEKHPLFVTHQGRLHAIEGHHRIAAALQRGDSHIIGWHHDLDKHPIGRDPLQPDEDCRDCHYYQDDVRGFLDRHSVHSAKHGAKEESRAYPIEEVKGWHSNDYDGRVGDAPWDEGDGEGGIDPYKVEQLSKEIRRSGMQRPLHAAAPGPGDDTPSLIHGHHRLFGAEAAGLTHVPVVMHQPHVDDRGDVNYPTIPFEDEWSESRDYWDHHHEAAKEPQPHDIIEHGSFMHTRDETHQATRYYRQDGAPFSGWVVEGPHAYSDVIPTKPEAKQSLRDFWHDHQSSGGAMKRKRICPKCNTPQQIHEWLTSEHPDVYKTGAIEEGGIVHFPVESLSHIPYEDDPSRLTKLRDSVRQHGIKEPIEIWNHKGHVSLMDGAHRLQVARDLGITHIPAKIWKSAGELGSTSVDTGDSVQRTTDLGAIHNVDVANYPPGTLCAMCNLQPCTVTVNHTPVCDFCAEARFGVDRGGVEHLFGQTTASLIGKQPLPSKEGMAWHNHGGMDADKVGARSVRDAGFKGYVGSSDWEDREDLHHQDRNEFDEDLWEKHTPDPTNVEKTHFQHHDEYPDSYHERHEEAYGKALEERKREDTPDQTDDHLHHWIAEHSEDPGSFTKHAKQPKKVDLRGGVYATQSHVGQFHIDRYLARGEEEPSWHSQNGGFSADYLGDKHPLFVTHQGRLHAIEGHHRVAAALQRGDTHITGWHHDLDKHPIASDSLHPEDECDDCRYHHDNIGEWLASQNNHSHLGAFNPDAFDNVYHPQHGEAARQIGVFQPRVHRLLTHDEDSRATPDYPHTGMLFEGGPNPRFEQPAEANIGKYLYHHSPPENRDSILQHGLMPHDPQERSAKDSGIDPEDTPYGVYLGPYDHIRPHRRHHDIWAVDTNDVHLNRDPDDHDNYWGFHYTQRSIPPESLRLIHKAGEPDSQHTSVWQEAQTKAKAALGAYNNVEWVPLHELKGLREYDRTKNPNTDLDALTEDIRQNGLKSPLIIQYGKNDRRAKLGEGNHRLVAAERLGISHLPARVLRTSTCPDGYPVPGHKEEFDQYGHPRHVNADLRPSEIGLSGQKEPPGQGNLGKIGLWQDVQAKAARLRSDGKVRLLELPTADNPYLFGEVEGDHGFYHPIIHREGNKKLAFLCECVWGDYSENGPLADRRAPQSPYRNRMCAHALSLIYELQSRSMFGRKPHIGVNNAAEFARAMGRHQTRDQDGNVHTGVMVALAIPEELAQEMAVEGGESARELHVTIGYLGKGEDVDEAALHQAVLEFCRTAPDSISGKITGFGDFKVDPEFNDGFEHVHIGLVSIPGFDKLRQDLVECLAMNGLAMSEKFGPQPHISIMYSHEPLEYDEMPPVIGREITWPAITVAHGGTWKHYPLSLSKTASFYVEADQPYAGEHVFKFHIANPKSMGGIPTHTLEAWKPEEANTPWAEARPEDRNHYAGSADDPGHRPVASISWHHHTGEIMGVYSNERRQGIATELLRRARNIAANTYGVVSPKHSKDRTNAGDAWAKSLGERLPRRNAKADACPECGAEKPFHNFGCEEDSAPRKYWGSNDLDSLFKGSSETVVPFKGAGNASKRYDKQLVHDTLQNHPQSHEIVDFDPRHLKATQPGIQRPAMEHYMGEEYQESGKTFADSHNEGNRLPVVYTYHHPVSGQEEHMILSGHHRATRALLRGEMLKARQIRGPVS